MIHTLRNEYISASFSSLGAELQSLVNNANQQEYMWSGDPAFWGKYSPVLFPIVGGLKQNTYTHKNKHYQLARHGFAREKEFTVTAQSDSSICFTLNADAATLPVYPFLFSFSIIYTLQQHTLRVNYEVTNTGDDTMYFSVGAHPAFAVPLIKSTVYTDHYLLFDQKETADRWPLSSEGLLLGQPVTCLQNQDQLPLTKELFYGDALVFKKLRASSISIRNHVNPHGLTVSYTDFPYMGIWSAKNADFVCIEPWCGIADSVNTSGEIAEKEGIHHLDPSQTFTRSWQVEIF